MDRASIEKHFAGRHLTTCHTSEAPLGANTVHLEELFVAMKISLTFSGEWH
jgi:hypothetical protein